MVKDSQTIYLDYEKAMNQVKALYGLEEQLKGLHDRDLADCIEGIGAHWKGDNATAYLKKAGELSNKLGTTAENIGTIADAIKRIAWNTYQAEMRAIELAQQEG